MVRPREDARGQSNVQDVCYVLGGCVMCRSSCAGGAFPCVAASACSPKTLHARPHSHEMQLFHVHCTAHTLAFCGRASTGPAHSHSTHKSNVFSYYSIERVLLLQNVFSY